MKADATDAAGSGAPRPSRRANRPVAVPEAAPHAAAAAPDATAGAQALERLMVWVKPDFARIYRQRLRAGMAFGLSPREVRVSAVVAQQLRADPVLVVVRLGFVRQTGHAAAQG